MISANSLDKHAGTHFPEIKVSQREHEKSPYHKIYLIENVCALFLTTDKCRKTLHIV